MMARVSTMSGHSSVEILDNKHSKKRRDTILGISASSASYLVPFMNGNEINDLSEEDIWGEEVRADEDEENREQGGYCHDNSKGKQKLGSPKVIGGNRRWALMRDKESFADNADVARGLSLLSKLDSELGGRLEQDAKPTASRMIPFSQYIQSDDAEPQFRLHQSAPLDIPDWAKILGSDKHRNGGMHTFTQDDDEDGERLPPHELLAREYARNQRTAFSVLEGVGRTLKGRDMSRVRDAVLRRTGFIDF